MLEVFAAFFVVSELIEAGRGRREKTGMGAKLESFLDGLAYVCHDSKASIAQRLQFKCPAFACLPHKKNGL